MNKGKSIYIKVSGGKSFWKQPVEVMEMDEAIHMVLKRNNINTLEELTNVWDKLTTLKNIGNYKAQKIKASFFAYLCDVPSVKAPTRIEEIW